VERVRLASFGALVVVLSIVGVAVGSAIPSSALNDTSWPTSTLLLSEVQTGGASASDEFIELTNAGPSTVDLAGLEVVYVTSTGGTITRKATWAGTQPLEPGRHILIVNSAGAYAGIGDASYSGGLAATGGAVVLRLIAGAPIDAVGWGDATNSFVETTRAPAPPASSSLERRPGGLAGNTIDTNDNAADWFAQSGPNPQGLAAPPVPATPPSPSPDPSASGGASGEPSVSVSADPSLTPPEPSSTPTASIGPTGEPPASSPTPSPSSSVSPTAPSPTASGGPSATPAPTSVPSPSSTPVPSSTPSPTPSATPSPTATPTPSPSLTPTPIPSPSPTANPSPTPDPTVAIATARAQANDSQATINGVLTTRLAALDSSRMAFVQDETAGIALYLDAVPALDLPAGTLVRVRGILADRYALRTLRVAVADIVVLGQAVLPDPLDVATASVNEAVEGRRVAVIGTTVGSPTSYADGVGILVDDGSGSVRAIVGPVALGALAVPSGTRVSVVGPVGQRDSSGTGTTAYRIHATEAGELQVLPAPFPSPSPTPSPSPSAPPSTSPAPSASGAGPTPTPGMSPTPTPPPTTSPSPSPSPTSSPALISVRDARSRPIGSSVIVAGIVTADVGRIGSTSVVALADASGGLLVRIPAGSTAPPRGSNLQVAGPIAAPYGQLELRPAADGIQATGTAQAVTAFPISTADLGEATEGRLVELAGIAATTAKRSTTGELSIDLRDAGGVVFRVMATASSGVTIADLPVGAPLRVTGIVGQRASRVGALDGYRLWLRDRSDIRIGGAGPPGGSGSAGPSPVPTSPEVIGIATILAQPDGTAVVAEGTVTAGASLLDTSGRRIVIEDGTGAIEVLLADVGTAPSVGSRLRIDGQSAHAWGAPRLRAVTVTTLAGSGQIQPAGRTTPPGEADEWRLIRISGTIGKVERLGDRWRAELLVGGSGGPAMPILGQAGASIPSTAVIAGRSVTVTGIVKRPYPTATDRRFAILPRSASDLATGPSGSATTGLAGGGRASNSGTGGGVAAGAGPNANVADVTPDTDLATLLERLGQRVRVGGLIDAIIDGGFDLNDGTAIARVVLRADARELLPYLRTLDAIAATGRVEQVGDAPVVVVDAAGDLVRVGDLGQAVPIGVPAASPSWSAAPADVSLADAVSSVLQPQPGPVGLVVMAVLSLASLLGTLLRRRRARRLLRAAITARLATLQPSGE
jgi:hypothetical protein